jgi:hypothetical protein
MASTYAGSPIFGLAVRINMVPNPSEAQFATFFGVTGRFRLHGGSRGRMFMVSGLLYGPTSGDVAAARNTILSYDDGIARTLVDVEGTSWTNVVFTGAFEWVGDYGVFDDGSGNVVWARPYTAVFEGMI